MNTLQFDGQQIEFVLKSCRQSKNIRISVHADGRLVITKPKWVPERVALSFLKTKLAWVNDCLHKFRAQFKPAKSIYSREHFFQHRIVAKKIIRERLDFFSKFYGFDFKRVSIRNQKTRWGSCSRQGNLSFNYRLIFLKPEAMDYVIIHELCHLREFNHSPAFWRLVAKAAPDHKRWRQELKAYNL